MDIEIRHAEPEDYRAVQGIHAQPRVVWGTLQVPFPSLDSWRKRLEGNPQTLCSLVASVEQEITGSLALWRHSNSPRRRHAAELGMAVHDAWQGRGIGAALVGAALDLADNWLDLRRIELTVFTDNTPAVRLYEKHGFEIEGTLHGFAFREGRYVDAYAMARIAKGGGAAAAP